MAELKVSQRARNAAEKIRRGFGGKYDRDVETIALMFAEFEQAASPITDEADDIWLQPSARHALGLALQVTRRAQEFCEELQEDAEGVPQIEMKALHVALDRFEAADKLGESTSWTAALPLAPREGWQEEVGERKWPNELTSELRGILGMMCFEFVGLSQVYRAAGHEIPKRAEDEQAYFLHKLLGFWFERGGDWRKAAVAELQSVRAAADARAALSRTGEVSRG